MIKRSNYNILLVVHLLFK